MASARKPTNLDSLFTLAVNGGRILGISAAVDELPRYESPTAIATIRFTVEPVTIAGVTIPAG